MTPQIDVVDAVAIAAAAFGAWAWLGWWGVRVIRKELQQVTLAASATAEALTAHILLTEKRLTMLETEFAFVRRYLGRHGIEEK